MSKRPSFTHQMFRNGLSPASTRRFASVWLRFDSKADEMAPGGRVEQRDRVQFESEPFV